MVLYLKLKMSNLSKLDNNDRYDFIVKISILHLKVLKLTDIL